MAVVVVELEPVDSNDGAEIERGVEMREALAIARRLPPQAGPEPNGIDSEQKQILLPGIVLGERAGDLVTARQMDEAVAEVVAIP